MQVSIANPGDASAADLERYRQEAEDRYASLDYEQLARMIDSYGGSLPADCAEYVDGKR